MCHYCLPNTVQSVKVSRIVLLVTTGDYFRTLFSLGENRGLINFSIFLTLCLLFEIRPHRCKYCWSGFTEAWVSIESMNNSYKTHLYEQSIHHPIYSFQPEEFIILPSCGIHNTSNLWNSLSFQLVVISTPFQFVMLTY